MSFTSSRTSQNRIAGLMRRFWKRRQAVSQASCSRRNAFRRELEQLEDRTLFSLGFAEPTHVVYQPASGPVQSNASPSGYSPAQIRHAYEFEQITFDGVSGDGRGQTIAIVDAYDDPNIASDLAV